MLQTLLSVIFSLFLLEKKAYNERQYLKEWRRQRMGNGLSDRKADTQELMQIRQEAYEAASQLLAAAHPKKGSILVV